MRHQIALITLSLLPLAGYSQDMLTTRDGTEIKVKVIEITDKKVNYRSWDNLNGPIYSMDKDGVLFIKYENGKKELFKIEDTEYNTEEKLTLAERGDEDARANYHRAGGAVAGTYVATVICGGLIGLIPAIACSSKPPTQAHLDYPDSTLMSKSKYSNAYEHRAKKIKQGKVWGAWGLGILTDVVITLVFIAAVS